MSHAHVDPAVVAAWHVLLGRHHLPAHCEKASKQTTKKKKKTKKKERAQSEQKKTEDVRQPSTASMPRAACRGRALSAGREAGCAIQSHPHAKLDPHRPKKKKKKKKRKKGRYLGEADFVGALRLHVLDVLGEVAHLLQRRAEHGDLALGGRHDDTAAAPAALTPEMRVPGPQWRPARRHSALSAALRVLCAPAAAAAARRRPGNTPLAPCRHCPGRKPA